MHVQISLNDGDRFITPTIKNCHSEWPHAVRSNHHVLHVNQTEHIFFTFIHDRTDLWFNGSVTLDFIKRFNTIN